MQGLLQLVNNGLHLLCCAWVDLTYQLTQADTQDYKNCHSPILYFFLARCSHIVTYDSTSPLRGVCSRYVTF